MHDKYFVHIAPRLGYPIVKATASHTHRRFEVCRVAKYLRRGESRRLGEGRYSFSVGSSERDVYCTRRHRMTHNPENSAPVVNAHDLIYAKGRQSGVCPEVSITSRQLHPGVKSCKLPGDSSVPLRAPGHVSTHHVEDDSCRLFVLMVYFQRFCQKLFLPSHRELQRRKLSIDLHPYTADIGMNSLVARGALIVPAPHQSHPIASRSDPTCVGTHQTKGQQKERQIRGHAFPPLGTGRIWL